MIDSRLWPARWQLAHAHNWLERDDGLLRPRLLTRQEPIVANIPDEPPSASVIREIELLINGRVLSPAPKEGS